MSYETGIGVTIAAVGGSATAFTGSVAKIGGWERSVSVLDDTPLDASSGSYEQKVFAEIIEHGPIRVEVLVDGETETLPPLGKNGGGDTWTITFRSGRTISGTGAIINTVSSELETKTRRRETFDLQFDGKTGPTLSS